MKPAREYLWVMLKWRGPGGMTRGRSVHVPAEITDLEPDDQIARLRHIALEAKPNPAWRLVEYQIADLDRVVIERSPSRHPIVSLPPQLWIVTTKSL
jgi:hypothetical protein